LAPIELVTKSEAEKSPKRCASHKGCSEMTLDRYLHLVDWTLTRI